MHITVLSIKKWGNNLGVRLPAKVATEAKLHIDQQVEIRVEKGSVIISPVSNENLTLEQRLKQFDPDRHGGEAMASKHIGAEKW